MKNSVFHWIYRVCASVLIGLIAFAVVFTAMFFTPGLDGESAGGHYCPSAFSNPRYIVPESFSEDTKYTAAVYSDFFNEHTGSDELGQIDDPLEKTLALKKILLNFLEHDVSTGSDERINRLFEDQNLLLCSYDRQDISAADETSDWIFESNADELLTIDFDNEQNRFFGMLKLKNVLILWFFVILLTAVTFVLRNKIENYQKANKILRIITLLIVIPALLFFILGPILMFDSGEDSYGAPCSVSSAFDTPKTFSDSRSMILVGLISTEKALTGDGLEDVAKIKEEQNITYTQEEIDDYLEQLESIREKAIPLLEELKNTDTYKMAAYNSQFASSDCIRDARISLMFTLFGSIVLIGFLVFMFGNKLLKR